MNRVVLPNLGDDIGSRMERTDVLIILHCCHAGASLGGGDDTRTAEIMCACDDLSSADSRKMAISFTQRVSVTIRRMFQDNPAHEVVLSEVVATILGENIADGLKRRTVHHMVHGNIPILLRNRETAHPALLGENRRPPTGPTSPAALQIHDTSLALAKATLEEKGPEVRTLCTVRFSKDITEDILQRFLEWIKRLDNNFEVEV